jgi:hypothetical protein
MMRWPWVSRARVAERIESYNRFNIFADPCHFIPAEAMSAARGTEDPASYDRARSAVAAHQQAVRLAMIDAGLGDPRPHWPWPDYYVDLGSPTGPKILHGLATRFFSKWRA